jgi:hypothetical protein
MSYSSEIIEVRTLGGQKACVFIQHIVAVEECTPGSCNLYLVGGKMLGVHGSGPSVMAKIQKPLNLLSEGMVVKDQAEKAAG